MSQSNISKHRFYQAKRFIIEILSMKEYYEVTPEGVIESHQEPVAGVT